ncbi:peptidase domain-containing ABC transporter [Christiangramia echinicola]|uniref:ATP-binding cassette, subfamily B n=1 Tax=Christiangramia echinicola TaxID=279359 RepID=A0A1H1RGN8_9FLAO|nr:peptidase domain-containing ABC transporter [Christiangramia echinicola]SDS34079.1 ATP-binding cassette, subfamily B [Christiangramia echinicola]
MFGTINFPIYRQLDQMDCGPTCLKIITEYYGKNFNLNFLREISTQQKGGVSFQGLSEALEIIGLDSVGIKTNLQELIEDIPLPVIAHWEHNHFLVVYKVDNKNVFVSDPAIGRIKYSHNEFQVRWSGANGNEGVLLLVQPNGNFLDNENEENKPEGMGFLFEYLNPYKKYIGQITLGLFTAMLIQLILPFLTQSIVDYGINYENLDFIYLIVIAQLFLFLTRSFTEVIRDWLLLHISTKVTIAMVSDFLDKLLKLPITFFDSKTTGDFMQRIYDHQRVEEFLSGQSLTIFFDLLSIIVFAFVLGIFNSIILLIFLTGTALFLGWSLLFMKRKEILDHQQFDLNRKEQSHFLQIIMAVMEIKLNNSEERRKSEWKMNQSRLFGLQSTILKVDHSQIKGGKFINEVTGILIVFWSAKAVISGEISLGTMLAIQFIVGSLYIPISNTIDFLVGYQRAKLSLNRLAEIHNQKSEVYLDYNVCVELAGDIKLENISFNYGEQGSNAVLKNVSTIFPHGKVTAIVGASGSGKTSLLKILLKLYKPSDGRISIGKENFEHIEVDNWRRMCGVVLQNGILFNDTIERNITESKSDEPLNQKRLIESVEMTNLSGLINSLPIGYQTRIGEQGQLLSGGEKQRLLIARAIYKNPKYLFFDEATSSLDAENEKVITENLNHFYRDKTVIIVAHRLSTVKNADQILVMDKGNIVEQGNHLELLCQKGVYHKLIRNQL